MKIFTVTRSEVESIYSTGWLRGAAVARESDYSLVNLQNFMISDTNRYFEPYNDPKPLPPKPQGAKKTQELHLPVSNIWDLPKEKSNKWERAIDILICSMIGMGVAGIIIIGVVHFVHG